MGKERDLRERTMVFALSVLRFCRSMPETPEDMTRVLLDVIVLLSFVLASFVPVF